MGNVELMKNKYGIPIYMVLEVSTYIWFYSSARRVGSLISINIIIIILLIDFVKE